MAARLHPYKAVSWCFTLNNYNDAELSKLRALGTDESKYLILGAEVGAEGTPHIQGFWVAKKRITFENARAKLGERCHLESLRGTHQQASVYCQKGGHFTEYGSLPTPGSRSDLRSSCDLLRDSKSLRRLADEQPEVFVRFHSGFRALFITSSILTERAEKSFVHVYVGPPGTGKSRRAKDEADTIGRVYYKPNGEWWDGYEGQECVIFDDFYGNYPFHDLLKCLDRYPHQVPVKGSFVQLNPKHIYITSNKPIHRWYDWAKVGQKEALYRRVDEYLWIGSEGTSDALQRDQADLGEHELAISF